MNIVLFILIGLAAGWLAGQLTKGRGFGTINNLIIGVIGAILGGVLFSILGIAPNNLIGELVMATVGAIVVLGILGMIGKKGR